MAAPNDDGYATAVIETVRDLTALVEEHKRSGEEGRANLLSTVEQLIASLRQDVHKTVASVQIAIIEDKNERSKRQAQVDAQMSQIRNWVIGALVGIGIVGGILIGRLFF